MKSFPKKIILFVLFLGMFSIPFLSLHADHGEPHAGTELGVGTDGTLPTTEELDEDREVKYDMTYFMARGANVLLSIAGKATQFTGNVFDHAIIYSLHIASDPGVSAGVAAGWTTFRDLANMVFIFALLYIAIATILQLSNFDTKRTLGTLIVVGLLLNFSLFATKIVVDASNVLGCYFYSAVASVNCVSGTDSSGLFDLDPTQGIAGKFAYHTKITTLYDIPEGQTGSKLFTDWYTLLAIGVFGSIFLLVLAFAFLMGAILFIMRSVALLFLMILSPLAFIGFALPYTSGKAKEWWNKLISYSFVAPIFLILIFVVLEVMKGIGEELALGGGSAQDATLGFDPGFVNALAADGGGSTATGVIFNFLLVIGLTIAAIVVSKNLGDGMGNVAVSGANFVARNTVQRGLRGVGKGTFGNIGSRIRQAGDRTTGVTGAALRRVGGGLESFSYDYAKAPGADKAGLTGLAESKTWMQRKEDREKHDKKDLREKQKEQKEEEVRIRRKQLAEQLRKQASGADTQATRDEIESGMSEISNVADIAHVDGKTLADPKVARNLTPKMLKAIAERADKGELELTTAQRQSIMQEAKASSKYGSINGDWFTTQRGREFV